MRRLSDNFLIYLPLGLLYFLNLQPQSDLLKFMSFLDSFASYWDMKVKAKRRCQGHLQVDLFLKEVAIQFSIFSCFAFATGFSLLEYLDCVIVSGVALVLTSFEIPSWLEGLLDASDCFCMGANYGKFLSGKKGFLLSDFSLREFLPNVMYLSARRYSCRLAIYISEFIRERKLYARDMLVFLTIQTISLLLVCFVVKLRVFEVPREALQLFYFSKGLFIATHSKWFYNWTPVTLKPRVEMK